MSYTATRAYRKTCRTSASGRQIEAMAFAKAARLLEEARQSPGNEEVLRHALDFNRVVWTVIQAETTDPRTHLAAAVKAGLISLSLFVDRALSDLRRGYSRKDLAALISVNRDMAIGLFTNQD